MQNLRQFCPCSETNGLGSAYIKIKALVHEGEITQEKSTRDIATILEKASRSRCDNV